MSRRALPVAVAAAALVLVPSTASATPDHAPVDNLTGDTYAAHAAVRLSDGRQVHASLSESRYSPREGWRAMVSLSIQPAGPCWPTSACDSGTGYAFVEVDPRDLDIDRGLTGASVTDLDLTLQRWSFREDFTVEPVEEDVTVSLLFAASGDLVHDAYHGDWCGDGSQPCQGTRIDLSRDALAEVTVDGVSGSATGSVFHGRFVDAAIEKITPEDGEG
jgi:hypothetical protein